MTDGIRIAGLIHVGTTGASVLRGRSLWDRAVDRLGPQVERLVLAAASPGRLDGLGLPVVGPVAPGLETVHAGLVWAEAAGLTHLVTAEAATPFLPLDLAARLSRATERAGAPVALAAIHDEGRLQRQTTCGLWPVALREDLASALRQGVSGVTRWSDAKGAATALFAEEGFFRVDSREALRAAEEMLGAGD